MRRARARGGGGEAGGGEATGSFSRPFVRTPPGFLTGPGPPKQTGGHGSRGETIPHEGLAPWKTPPQKERPASPTPHPPPPGGFGGRAHLGRGAKVSGVGVRTGGKGSGAPYSSARGQCRRGGSLEPPGRGASGAPGLLGQKVLREQLLRPPSAPPFEYAPPPADTGRGRPPRPRPAPRPRDLRRRAPAPPTAAGSASGARADEHAHSQFSPRRFPRTRSPFPAHTRPPQPPPAIRPNVEPRTPGGSSDRYAGRGPRGQRAGADPGLPGRLPLPCKVCPGPGRSWPPELLGHPELPTNKQKAFTPMWAG